ncbi:MAG: sugar phosphate isomerase/epimerase [Chloroflexi bacterium]|nr:sugar phosphate isomerase/epimerase [Chloroflexota bacterium]
MSELKPIALQLYTVRELLGVDFEGTVRRVAEMGYIGVEPYSGMPCALSAAADLFRELGLQTFNSHVPFPDEASNDAIVEIAEAFDLSSIAIAMLPPDEFETIDSIKNVCERLNRAGEFSRANGLALHYHNHWWEFKRINGKATLDVMLDELDDDVGLQIDTYWAQVGGEDAVEVVKQAGERAPLIHLKDGWLDAKGDMAAVGHGAMNVPAIVNATAGTAEWYIVEQDRSNNDRLEAVQQSYTYLTTNGLARGKI